MTDIVIAVVALLLLGVLFLLGRGHRVECNFSAECDCGVSIKLHFTSDSDCRVAEYRFSQAHRDHKVVKFQHEEVWK